MAALEPTWATETEVIGHWSAIGVCSPIRGGCGVVSWRGLPIFRVWHSTTATIRWRR